MRKSFFCAFLIFAILFTMFIPGLTGSAAMTSYDKEKIASWCYEKGLPCGPELADLLYGWEYWCIVADPDDCYCVWVSTEPFTVRPYCFDSNSKFELTGGPAIYYWTGSYWRYRAAFHSSMGAVYYKTDTQLELEYPDLELDTEEQLTACYVADFYTSGLYLSNLQVTYGTYTITAENFSGYTVSEEYKDSSELGFFAQASQFFTDFWDCLKESFIDLWVPDFGTMFEDFKIEVDEKLSDITGAYESVKSVVVDLLSCFSFGFWAESGIDNDNDYVSFPEFKVNCFGTEIDFLNNELTANLIKVLPSFKGIFSIFLYLWFGIKLFKNPQKYFLGSADFSSGSGFSGSKSFKESSEKGGSE